MKRAVSPAVMWVLILVAVIIVGFFFYRGVKGPPKYQSMGRMGRTGRGGEPAERGTQYGGGQQSGGQMGR